MATKDSKIIDEALSYAERTLETALDAIKEAREVLKGENPKKPLDQANQGEYEERRRKGEGR